MKKRMKEDLNTYTKLVKLRNLLKQVSQLSWNFSQIEKRYPFEDVGVDQYQVLMDTYADFREDLYRIAEAFKDLEKDEN